MLKNSLKNQKKKALKKIIRHAFNASKPLTKKKIVEHNPFKVYVIWFLRGLGLIQIFGSLYAIIYIKLSIASWFIVLYALYYTLFLRKWW